MAGKMIVQARTNTPAPAAAAAAAAACIVVPAMHQSAVNSGANAVLPSSLTTAKFAAIT